MKTTRSHISGLVMLLGMGMVAAPVWANGNSVGPVDNNEYKEECGSCHFAYQPSLLPSGSWDKLMSSLDDHFGENAELDVAVRKRLTGYMVNNAADKADFRLSRNIMRSLGSELPLRIPEVRYIRHEHREIPARMVKGNDKVKSLSYCNRCHTTADKGSYSERGIDIPGYGRWDD